MARLYIPHDLYSPRVDGRTKRGRAIKEEGDRKVATILAARRLAEKIGKLDSFNDDIEKYAPHVLAIYKGAPLSAFWYIDNAGGYVFDAKDRYYLVRRVRNHPVWGKKLFDVLDPKR